VEIRNANRWSLIRDAFFFQLKLALDAIRDLLLSPASIICVVIDIFSGKNSHQSYFYRLMSFGQKSDQWLNLFGAGVHKTVQAETDSDTKKNAENSNADQLFDKIESLLKEQHNKGGLTASAKISIDNYMNKLIDKK
jgi:hypothetical protein